MTVIIWGLSRFVSGHGVGFVDIWGREVVQEIESDPDFRSVEAVISKIQGFM